MGWFKLKQSLADVIARKSETIRDEMMDYAMQNNLMRQAALFDRINSPTKAGTYLFIFVSNDKFILELKKKYPLEECATPSSKELTLLLGSEDLYNTYFG